MITFLFLCNGENPECWKKNIQDNKCKECKHTRNTIYAKNHESVKAAEYISKHFDTPEYGFDAVLLESEEESCQESR